MWGIYFPVSSTPGNEEDGEDIEMMCLEDITAEELEAELDRLHLRTTGPQDAAQQQVRPLPGKNPPPATKPHELYDLKEVMQYGRGLCRNP